MQWYFLTFLQKIDQKRYVKKTIKTANKLTHKDEKSLHNVRFNLKLKKTTVGLDKLQFSLIQTLNPTNTVMS